MPYPTFVPLGEIIQYGVQLRPNQEGEGPWDGGKIYTVSNEETARTFARNLNIRAGGKEVARPVVSETIWKEI